MALVRGTGDFRKMKQKGQVIGTSVATMRCPRCNRTAVMSQAAGTPQYTCTGCGATSVMQKF